MVADIRIIIKIFVSVTFVVGDGILRGVCAHRNDIVITSLVAYRAIVATCYEMILCGISAVQRKVVTEPAAVVYGLPEVNDSRVGVVCGIYRYAKSIIAFLDTVDAPVPSR